VASSDSANNSLQSLRILHLVSGEAQLASPERAALRAILSGIPRAKIEPQVVRFAKEDEHSLALRLQGVVVHDFGPLRQPFSTAAFRELRVIAQAFRPQLLHAWDYAAQVASLALRQDMDGVPTIWSMTSTRPRTSGSDQGWLRATLRDAHVIDAIVYTSRLSADAHQEAGFPAERRRIIEPGVDAELYKPDFAARRRVRAQLRIPPDAFVVSMHAPFARHVDHSLLLEAADALAEHHPQLHLLLAGTQVDLHNAALVALLRKVKGLAGRVHAVGRTIEMEYVYNASDVACSTATNDTRRLDLAAAMLCGVPCIAYDIDAQQELLGESAIVVQARTVTALSGALGAAITMAPAQRAALAHRARQHALAVYTARRTASRYRRLYEKLLDCASSEKEELETPHGDTLPP
jgi:glycosyltransferase involved in cell wall biosynthesis